MIKILRVDNARAIININDRIAESPQYEKAAYVMMQNIKRALSEVVVMTNRDIMKQYQK